MGGPYKRRADYGWAFAYKIASFYYFDQNSFVFFIFLNLVIMEKNSYDVRIKSVFASKQERVCACQTFIIFAERNLAAIPARRELIAVGSRGCTHTPCYVPVPIRQHHHDIQ